MAKRDYLHLVESDLREAGTLEREGALPPMLSIVVHNGERPWRAASEYGGPLTGDGRQAPMRMYATVDLPVLARGPDAEGRALAPGGRLATLLADVSDLSGLDEAGEWLMECDSGEALLERLRAAGRGTGNNAAG